MTGQPSLFKHQQEPYKRGYSWFCTCGEPWPCIELSGITERLEPLIAALQSQNGAMMPFSRQTAERQLQIVLTYFDECEPAVSSAIRQGL